MRSNITATGDKFACRLRRVLLALASSLPLGGCAVVPDAAWPTHHDREVCATYDLDGARGIDLPYSSSDFTIYGLVVFPLPARESFSSGRRELEFAPGTKEVTVRCRYRVYGREDSPTRLFPGAKNVTTLDLSHADKH
jgi:hypothetical protein